MPRPLCGGRNFDHASGGVDVVSTMSAFWLVLDVLLAAIVLRFVWPGLDGSTQALAIVFGIGVLVWKLERG
jgi:hypothetical protein